MEVLIAAVLAFAGGLVLWAIKRERKALEYEVIASETFPHGARSGKYFVIRFGNNAIPRFRTLGLGSRLGKALSNHRVGLTTVW